MADPAIQTFCCVANNRTSLGLNTLLRNRYESYNIICIVSSIFGIFGACYQILPRKFEGTGRTLESFLRGRQIIVWLATADLLASLAVLIRSVSWIVSQISSVHESFYGGSLFCAISSGWIQYFYGATYLWTLIYAVDVLRLVFSLPGLFVTYHLIAWTVPFLLTLAGLLVMYYPNLSCETLKSSVLSRILPNYCVTYLPIVIVMLVNPLIYLRASKQAEKVVSSTGRYTSTERRHLSLLRFKFLSINLVFILCWIPNLFNAVAIWSLWDNEAHEPILVSAYFMALLNPLQALFNVFVYRKWGDHPSTVRIQVPGFCHRGNSEEEIHLLYDDGPGHGEDGLGNQDSLSSLSAILSLPAENPKRSGSPHSINGYGSVSSS